MKYIVQSGLSIKSFERESGVLFGDTFISKSNTYENNAGELIKKDSYFVSEKKSDGLTTYYPSSNMKKLIILLALYSCSKPSEKPVLSGNHKDGYVVSYHGKILYSDDYRDIQGMIRHIVAH